ncbi:MAG: prenyltransferase/squalene oxidase repeat-containing protein [Bryobacterales bacterium]
MRSFSVCVLAAMLLLVGWQFAVPDSVRGNDSPKAEKTTSDRTTSTNSAESLAVRQGVDWLVSVQGADGGWGQDGGETSYVRSAENLETNGNDVANTAVATHALLRAGHTATKGKYREPMRRGVEFILRNVESSPPEGLAITSVTGTQIQRKLGPYIDTFLTSMLLAEIDGEMGDAKSNRRVRAALEKCVRKIEENQQHDGSWNISGGWAPILGTSMASRSLFLADKKGVEVETTVMAKVDEYTKDSARFGAEGFRSGPSDAGRYGGGVAGGVGGGVAGGVIGGIPGGAAGTVTIEVSAVATEAAASSAGVALYKGAQVIEQLSRTEADREKNAFEIAAVTESLDNANFTSGFGSMGGEEFFSYLNISDSLHRSGGEPWNKWNTDIKTKLVKLQNEEGSWAGHHCITGRVAVTSAAVLTLLVENSDVSKH